MQDHAAVVGVLVHHLRLQVDDHLLVVVGLVTHVVVGQVVVLLKWRKLHFLSSLLNLHDLRRRQKSVFIHLQSDQLAMVRGNQVPSVLPNQWVSANKIILFVISSLLHLL